MTDDTKPTRKHRRWWVGAIAGVVLLAVFGGLAFYLRSASFEELVRQKVVAALEDASGGRVEMASFHWNLSKLAFEANDLTIHGLEPPGQLPYAHVARAFVRLHLISLVERRFNVQRVELQNPEVHLIVNADGSTNAPAPKVKAAGNQSAMQELFDLSIGRADLRNGMLVINERKLPFDFTANDVSATMSYDRTGRAHRYVGRMQVGKINLKYEDWRDLPASADLQFTLWENALEIESLNLTSQQSSLRASGKLTNFSQPAVQVTYNSSFDIPQLGAVARAPELRGGTLLINGTLDYSQTAGYSTDGHIAFRNLDYLNSPVVLNKTNMDANFTLAQDRLALNRIAAHVFGGLISGDAEVTNVFGTAAAQQVKEPEVRGAKRRTMPATPSTNEQQGTAKLRAGNLSLNDLMRLFASRSLSLEKLNAVGAVAGSVNLQWKQSPENAVADLVLDITAPSQAAPNQLPVNGSVRGRAALRAERIELSALNIATPRSHLDATGFLGATSAMLRLKAETSSVAEWRPLVSTSSALPVELGGSASFDGTLSGRLRTPEIAGHLQATNMTYLYTPQAPRSQPPPAPSPKHNWFHAPSARQTSPVLQTPPAPRRIHVDSFVGDVQYSQTTLALHHTVIQEGGAQLHIDGTSALDEGNFTGSSQFQVQASLHNGDLTELQRVAQMNYPLQGKLSFAVHAAGTASNPHGEGQLSLSDADWHNRPIKALTSKVNFADHAVQFSGIHLQAARGTIAGLAAYNFRTSEAQIDLKGQSVDLADIPEVQTQRLQVAGVANFSVKGSGTVEHPLLNAHFEITKLALNDESIGQVTADAVTHDRQLTLTARSTFPRATLTLDGNVDLGGEMPAHAVLHFANLDINPFLPEKMRAQVTRQASLDGQAQLDGPLRQPRLLHGTLNIQQFSVEVKHIPVKSDGPVQLSFADEVLSVQHCTISSEDTHFTLTGTMLFAAERRLDLQANGELSLKLAQTLYPDITSYGTANVNLTVRGTVAQPVMTGRVAIAHAGFSMIDLPAGLGDVNGTLTFNQDRLELENVAGRMGGGRVKLAGFVSFGRTLGFDLSADGTDIRFRYSGISVTSDQTLRLAGTLQNASLTGNITVTRFAQIPSADLQYLVSQANAPPSIPNPNSPLNNLHLEVRILSTPELTVETSLAKLSGDVDLRLRGTAARPVLLGRINIAEGDIKVAGTKYHLERGDITFVNPVRIDPVLDVEATTRVRDYDITIGLHGTMERLNTTYRSDPPLSTDDIVSLLAFGKTQTEQALGGTPGASGFAESASGALLSSALNQAVTNRVSRIFGASSIRINPSVGGPENDPNARLTLEQQVSNNITFTYITNLARSAQEVIQFEYNINRDYSLQGIRDENGVVSFDLLIRKRKQ